MQLTHALKLLNILSMISMACILSVLNVLSVSYSLLYTLNRKKKTQNQHKHTMRYTEH